MQLTPEEKKILSGKQGKIKALALDYLVRFGDAFGAKKLINVDYVHITSGHAYQKGEPDYLEKLAGSGAKVEVFSTANTICTDMGRYRLINTPENLIHDQLRVFKSHKKMGMTPVYTCAPYLVGCIPPKGSYISTVESSAIIYYNSVLGARTNRGGYFTVYSALTGKYPLMGFLLDENRIGTHLVKVKAELKNWTDYSALGYHVGEIVGSGIPVFEGIQFPTTEDLIQLGASLATSGSVSLYHIPGITAEASTIKDAFKGRKPKSSIIVSDNDIKEVYKKLNSSKNKNIDFVLLGCPHYSISQIEKAAKLLAGKKINKNIKLWITTARITMATANVMGYTKIIEDAGGLIVCDTCPIESFLRADVAPQYGVKWPPFKCMLTDSAKQAKYAVNLLGCDVILANTEDCIRMALKL